MLLNGMSTEEDHIFFGTKEDTCTLCELELAKEKQITLQEARQELQGSLSLQKIFVVPNHGLRTVICKKHLEEIIKKL